MAHRNARTNVYARRLIVERFLAGWPAARVAEQFGVSRATVHKWVRRYREDGWAGLADRCSRPHTSPCRTSPRVEASILELRATTRRGALFVAGELGLVASTVGRVLATLAVQQRPARRPGHLGQPLQHPTCSLRLDGQPPITRLTA